jgi:hypothetical protein
MSAKRENAAIAATIDLSNELNGRLILEFSNGKRLALNAHDITPQIATMATFHGLKQKLVDAAAISRNPDTGRSATIDDKYEAVKTVFDRLLSGSWNAVREGGGGSGGLLFRALCRMYPAKTPESLREYLEAKTAAEQSALRKNPRVAAIIEEIKAERGADDSTDSDAMLDELND